MVKTYLRFDLKTTLGQIISNSSLNIALSMNKKYIYCACNDYILCYDLKTSEQVLKITNLKNKITCLSINSTYLSVGYENGSVALIDISLPLNEQNFSEKKYFNHKSAITSLDFNNDSSLILSGSLDTNLIISDIIGDINLYKFNGHKDNIIKCEFYKNNENFILSLSKDNTFKIWNIKNQLCIYTYVDMIHKIINYINYNNIIIFGAFDEKIKIHQINDKLLNLNENKINNKNLFIQKGTINKKSKNKIINFFISDDNKILSILSNDNSVEFFKILSKKEIKYRLISNLINKDKNIKKEKLIQNEKFISFKNKAKEIIKNESYDYGANYASLFMFEHTNKNLNKNDNIFYTFIIDKNHFGVCSNKNYIEIYFFSTDMLINSIYNINSEKNNIVEVFTKNDNLKCKREFSIKSLGHREAIRYIKYSNNSELFITLSNDSIKLWNILTYNCIKSLKLKNGTSAIFLNRDNIIVISTRSGDLYILNTNSFEVLTSIEKAHDDAIWNLTGYQINSKKYRVITCSTDKKIKYWNIIYNEKNVISIENENEIEVIDSITYLLLTNNQKYLIYSLMDNSIKVIYEDSQKIFLNLYGHKMPVTCFDISSDNLLLVSGSSDKNVKIWGMDFGDCHKTFLAHNDIINCVKFFNKTHYFLTCSKDRTIKFYDGDAFELVMEYNNDFYDSIWWLDINKEGTQFIACSSDFSIKLYEITEEQVIPKDAYDERIEKLMNDEAEKEFNKKDAIMNPLNKEIDSLIPIKKRMDNIEYAENLMDAINLCEKYKEEVYQYEINMEEYYKNLEIINSKDKKKIKDAKLYNLEVPEKPTQSALFMGMNIFEYILDKIKNIRSSELENSLNNLPYSYFQQLLYYLEYYIRNNIEVELIGRCVIFFSVLFQNQISNDKTILRYMISIKKHLKPRIQMGLDIINFNMKGIDLLLYNNNLREKALEEYKNEKQQNLDFIL